MHILNGTPTDNETPSVNRGKTDLRPAILLFGHRRLVAPLDGKGVAPEEGLPTLPVSQRISAQHTPGIGLSAVAPA